MTRREEIEQSLDGQLIKLLKDFSKTDRTDIDMESLVKDDLGIDSVDTLDLTFVLEKNFQIEILDKDIGRIKTVRDLKNIVTRRLVRRA